MPLVVGEEDFYIDLLFYHLKLRSFVVIDITAEYALRDIAKPIGVAEWQTKLVQSLPDSLKGRLPSIAEIEAELQLRDGESSM